MKSTADEKTYFEQHGDELLRRIGISKTEFAERMGVKKQNVNTLFTTKNILVLRKAAQVLGVPLDALIANPEEPLGVSVCGYLEVNGELFKIRSKEELLRVAQLVGEQR